MILCAAVKIHVDATGKDVVIPCRRHCDAFHILRDMGFEPKQGYNMVAQGFIKTDGGFLTREEAYAHAINCGQLSETTKMNLCSGHLFSEDLY